MMEYITSVVELLQKILLGRTDLELTVNDEILGIFGRVVFFYFTYLNRYSYLQFTIQ